MPKCTPSECDTLHLADDNLYLALPLGAATPNRFVREGFVACWRKQGRIHTSTQFPCIGSVEQWVRKHLLPSLQGVDAEVTIMRETTFSVWEPIATRRKGE